MTVTSAPIGSSAQSLDGFAVNANVPAAFRESVVLTDPSDPAAAAQVSSTQPITGYAIAAWIMGTPNFSSTVNVTNNITVSASTQIVSSIPIIVSQSTSPWVVSSAPIALVGTSQVFGTVSTQIVSSIPFFVAQSSAPWTMNGGVAVTNVPTVNVTNVPAVTINGTSFVSISSSQPIIVAQSTNPWTVNGSTFGSGTTQVNIVSSIPLGGGTQYLSGATTSGPTGNIMMFASGTSSQTMQAVNSTQALPVNIVSTVTQLTNIVSSIPFFVAQSSAPWIMRGNTTAADATAVPTGSTLPTLAFLMGLNSSGTWDRVLVEGNNNDGEPVTSTGLVSVESHPMMFNGTTWDRLRGNSSAGLSVTLSTAPLTVSVAAIPVTQGGLSAAFKVGLTTASFTVKASAGKLHDLWFTNTATSTRWLKLYNASSAAVGTTAPLMVFGMPGTTTGANAIAGWISSAMGIQFSTSIFAAATASSATSTDTSTPAAGDIIVNFGYI